MFRRFTIAVLALGFVGLGLAASAAPVDNTVVTYDVFGARIDAHDGDLWQAPSGGLIYLYGTSYACGFQVGIASPYCGVRVYTSTDLQTWTPAGALGGMYAFDHLTADWQTLCTSPNYGCYRPHVVQRPSDGKFVMWLDTHGDNGYKVLVADSPAGPFVDTGIIPNLAVKPATGGLRYGDEDLTIGPDGTGYVSYTAINPATNAHNIVIEQLDATLTTGTGAFVQLPVPQIVEAPALFLAPTGTWHMVYSDPAQPYRVTGTGIMNAPTPLGPWTSPRSLNSVSCSGQPTGVWPIKGPSGATSWVWGTDRWNPDNPNQYLANNYYSGLTFNANGGTAIDAANCAAYWTLP